MTADALGLAHRLTEAHIPVIYCSPNGSWQPGVPNDLNFPAGWSRITADDQPVGQAWAGRTAGGWVDLDGLDLTAGCLAMVTGHGVDVMDIDAKDGGHPDHLPTGIFTYGARRTPSGGWHFVVASTRRGKVNGWNNDGKHLGDYCGGTEAGGSRALAFLGGYRPKYPQGGYVTEVEVDLTAALAAEPDPVLVGLLEKAGASTTAEPGKTAAPAAEVRAFFDGLPPTAPPQCLYGRAAIAGILADADGIVPGDPKKGRHGWAIRSATRLVELARAGCIGGDELTAFAHKLHEIKPEEDPWASLAWGLSNADGTVKCDTHRDLTAWVDDAGNPLPNGVAGLLAHVRTWLDLPDDGHILATLAVAATSHLDGPPCWLLVVAPPSAGKTEAVHLLDRVADAKLNEVTVAGLLGWSSSKPPRPSGVLVRIGARGLVTFGDLSSLLATSDRGGRDNVFGQLRRVYDGHTSRDVQPPGGRGGADGPLVWSGRATVIAAVTGAIDNYSAHADSLGPRWLYVRIDARNTDARRRAARMARRGGIGDRRKESATLAARLVGQARDRIGEITVPDAIEDVIEDAALVTCWGRASVPRSGIGRREPIGAAEVEEPPRLVRQASMLARGLLALGIGPDYTAGLVRRCILDSMPATRRAVLTALADNAGTEMSTAEVAREAGLHRHVARMALEDLEAVGPVEGRRVGGDTETDEEREDRRARLWTLANTDDGQLVGNVFAAHREQVARNVGTTHTAPPDKGQDSADASHTSCHGHTPTTRAEHLSTTSTTTEGAAS